VCLALTRQQIDYWKDGETLFRHTLRVTEDNYLAHYDLGLAVFGKGELDEAIRQFQEALRLKPDFTEARKNLEAARTTMACSLPPPDAATNRWLFLAVVAAGAVSTMLVNMPLRTLNNGRVEIRKFLPLSSSCSE
jgi:tetratricopeptide (TPR) repeat protein